MTTPHGEVEFTNLVYTFDADAPRKLVLSAHFDSKWFKQGGVSTTSAVVWRAN
jgi:hypothetical protein